MRREIEGGADGVRILFLDQVVGGSGGGGIFTDDDEV